MPGGKIPQLPANVAKKLLQAKGLMHTSDAHTVVKLIVR